MSSGSATEFSAAQDPLPDETGHGSGTGFWALTLGSVGVVYGDIGTSPLYALKESLHAAAGGSHAPTREMVFGVVSLILWALILIVTIKYVLIVMRADNDGRGRHALPRGPGAAGARPVWRRCGRTWHGRYCLVHTGTRSSPRRSPCSRP